MYCFGTAKGRSKIHWVPGHGTSAKGGGYFFPEKGAMKNCFLLWEILNIIEKRAESINLCIKIDFVKTSFYLILNDFFSLKDEKSMIPT